MFLPYGQKTLGDGHPRSSPPVDFRQKLVIYSNHHTNLYCITMGWVFPINVNTGLINPPFKVNKVNMA